MRTQARRDYYEVLGVSRDATPERIREAYVALSRSLHPDLSDDEDAGLRFAEVAEAYDVLSRPDSRLLYDRLAYRGPGNRGFGPPHPGVGKPTADSTHLSDEELIDWIFTGRPPGGSPEVVGELKIGSVEARRGTRRTVAFEALTYCADCQGSGASAAPQATRPCPDCAGTGRQRTKSADGAKLLFELDVCSSCDGSGRTPHVDDCPSCDGLGAKIMKRKCGVHIPAGVRDGQEVVVDRITGPDGADRNAVVVLRVAEPRKSHRAVQIAAAAALLVVLAAILLVLVR